MKLFSRLLVMVALIAPESEAQRVPTLTVPLPNGSTTEVGPVANVFWQHPMGDTTVTPCTHMAAQHAGGDPVLLPCAHMVLEHPAGHDTGKKYPNGQPIMTPCTHTKQEHAGGHATGQTVACVHQVAQHPAGHPGPITPCAHPLQPVRVDQENNIVFFTADPNIQNNAINATKRLAAAGIKRDGQRPLNIFNHPPAAGYPDDNKNPLWSRYNPVEHSIQLMGGRSTESTRDTLFHEMGHALLGHSAVQIHTLGGPHSLCNSYDAGMAMSEGWAHLIGVFLSNNPTSYRGHNWETGMAANCTPPFDQGSEFRVACVLWDLLDSSREDKSSDGLGLGLAPLFKVYSPTMTTLRNGPIIPSLDDYLTRLKANQPGIEKSVDTIRNANLTAPG